MSRASRPVRWVGTSWKMTKSRAEAVAYATVLRDRARPGPGLGCFVVPSFTLIDPVASLLHGSPVAVGAQDVHWEPSGAFTGEVSVGMVADAGATLVEIGHSERRALFGETDETVAWKTRAVLAAGLTALVCVGEPAVRRERGDAVEFVLRQARAAISAVPEDARHRLMLAYEPVWAIGEGGQPATPEQAGQMHRAIRGELVDAWGDAGHGVPILYGGSVTLGNAVELLAEPFVDGLFVGRAAWDVDIYLQLIAAASDSVGETADFCRLEATS